MNKQVTASIELTNPQDPGIKFGRLTVLVFDNADMLDHGGGGEHIMYQERHATLAQCLYHAVDVIADICKLPGYEPGRIIIRPDAR